MTTTALIAYNNNGTVMTISAKSDGYLSYTGKHLLKNYDEQTLAQLMSHGCDVHQITENPLDVVYDTSSPCDVFGSLDELLATRAEHFGKPFLHGHLHAYIFTHGEWFYYTDEYATPLLGALFDAIPQQRCADTSILLENIKEVAELSSNTIYETVEHGYVRGYTDGLLKNVFEEMQLSREQLDIALRYVEERRRIESRIARTV